MSDEQPALLAYHCTCPNLDVADRLARTLVEERLAACVSRVPGVVSTYRWQGQVEVAAEVLLLIKTTQERFEGAAHPAGGTASLRRTRGHRLRDRRGHTPYRTGCAPALRQIESCAAALTQPVAKDRS